ncbi:MAG: ergothioneine biosynthesis protein EgtB [Gammaproteobacteria bacterium]|nr:ergothioneine biosynthesis protein EgtB [Gammaproteobacteria bacterium]
MAATPEFQPGAESLGHRYRSTRSFTEALAAPLSPEDMVVQSMPDVSPTKWHLAHVSWFFENFLLAPHLPGYAAYDERFGYLFNSYYYQVGQMHRRAERGFLSRPSVAEILAYRQHVDKHMEQLLDRLDEDKAAHVGVLVELGIQHEQQHQELLLTDIKHVLSQNPLKPAYHDMPEGSGARAAELAFIDFAGGIHDVGQAGPGFHFDNEGPAHQVLLQDFAMANRPVTNREYREFILAGGYREPRWWLSEGWATILAEDWSRPFYWQEDLASEFTLGGVQALNPDAPVSHLSYFEADAYASWAGKHWEGARLPTEFEWEVFARQQDTRMPANTADLGRFHPDAADSQPVSQVWGDVWEWTRSSYSPYPGYSPPAGAIGEYNGKFMSGQFVLRGGSCATSRDHIRSTYRNFFYPPDRWQFTGLRLAR